MNFLSTEDVETNMGQDSIKYLNLMKNKFMLIRMALLCSFKKTGEDIYKNTIEGSECICRILYNDFKIQNGEVPPVVIKVTEILSANDIRKLHPSFRAAKTKDIKD